MAGTAQMERARTRTQEKNANNTKPVTVDPTDPETLANANKGGPSVPSSVQGESTTPEVLNGTAIDWTASISKAQFEAQRARKGRQTADVLTSTIKSHLQSAVLQFTADDATDDEAYIFPFNTTNGALLNVQKQMPLFLAANDLAGVQVKFSKHALSPNKRSTAAADAGKEVYYIAAITWDNQENTDEENTDDSDDETSE